MRPERRRRSLTSAACAIALCAAAGFARAEDHDTALWRATHGLLLGAARAGNRLVAVGDRGHVLLSDDNGATWRLRQAPTEEALTAVVFTSPQEGWAVGQDVTVMHSTDGGESWTQQHFTANADQSLFSVTVLGPAHLFASGAYNITLETRDGTHWDAGKIPDLDDDYHLNCAIARGDDLLVTGEAGHAFLRQGTQWAKIPVPYDGSQFGCLLDDAGRFYSFGLRGSLFRAVRGVAGWKRLTTPDERSIFGGARLPDGRLALVGATGLAMILDPATDAIGELDTGTDQALSAAVPTADGQLLAVGRDGVHLVRLTPAASSKGDVR